MLFSRRIWLAVLGVVTANLVTACPLRAVEPDKMVPADAEMVLFLNVRQGIDSPLVKTYALEHLKAGIKQNDQANKLLAAAGLDPLKDIDSVTVANSGVAPKNKTLIVTRGKFNLDKIQTAAQDHAKTNPKELKISTEGNTTVYELLDETNSNFAAFADGSTLVLSNTKEQLLSALKKENTGKLNKDMLSALKKVKVGKNSSWVAAVVTDEMKQGLAGNEQTKDLAPKLESVIGTLSVSDELTMEVLINTTDAATAAKIAKAIGGFKQLLPILAPNEEAKPLLNLFTENLKVNTDQNAATLALDVTEAMIKQALLDAKKPSTPGKQK